MNYIVFVCVNRGFFIDLYTYMLNDYFWFKINCLSIRNFIKAIAFCSQITVDQIALHFELTTALSSP